MTSPICPISSNSIHMSSKMMAPAIILMAAMVSVSALFYNNAYAEEPSEVLEKAKIAAEMEFAEAITKAKAQYNEIRTDPNADSDALIKAKQDYNKAIENAKKIRDQKIEDAQKEYAQTLQSKPTVSIVEAREKYLETITTAKNTLEQALADAQQTFDEAITNAIDDDAVKTLEQEYENTVSEIKKIYNDTIATAKAEFDKIKNMGVN